MKKLLVLATIMVAAVLFTACEKEKKSTTAPALGEVKGALIPENTVSVDRQYMFNTYGKDYAWFETCIVLDNYLDEKCDGSIASVENVFQYVVDRNVSIDPIVVISKYNKDGKHTIEAGEGIWVGDVILKDEEIKLTYKEAFDKMMQCKLAKPHSKYCVLRNPLGPKICNPQYIFGNATAQIFVDAITGDCSDENPAFKDLEDGFKAPLGEWP